MSLTTRLAMYYAALRGAIQGVVYMNYVPRIVQCTTYTPVHYGSGNPHYSLRSMTVLEINGLPLGMFHVQGY